MSTIVATKTNNGNQAPGNGDRDGRGRSRNDNRSKSKSRSRSGSRGRRGNSRDRAYKPTAVATNPNGSVKISGLFKGATVKADFTISIHRNYAITANNTLCRQFSGLLQQMNRDLSSIDVEDVIQSWAPSILGVEGPMYEQIVGEIRSQNSYMTNFNVHELFGFIARGILDAAVKRSQKDKAAAASAAAASAAMAAAKD
jgi:hypothetical protein